MQLLILKTGQPGTHQSGKRKGFSPLVFDLSDAEVRIGSGISEPASIFKAGEVLLSDLDALIVRDVGRF